MSFSLVARPQPSKLMVYLSPLLALILTLFSGFLMFSLMGIDGLDALYAFFILPISDSYGFSELLVKAIPLILIGVGLSIGFKANVWNIGAEGQLVMGAVAAGGVALFAYESESIWVLPRHDDCRNTGRHGLGRRTRLVKNPASMLTKFSPA